MKMKEFGPQGVSLAPLLGFANAILFVMYENLVHSQVVLTILFRNNCNADIFTGFNPKLKVVKLGTQGSAIF